MFVVRGRPPGLAAGISRSIMAHSSSVKSLVYRFRLIPPVYRLYQTFQMASKAAVYFYLVESWSGTPMNLQPHEHTEIQWFSLSQALQLKLADPIYPQLF